MKRALQLWPRFRVALWEYRYAEYFLDTLALERSSQNILTAEHAARAAWKGQLSRVDGKVAAALKASPIKSFNDDCLVN